MKSKIFVLRTPIRIPDQMGSPEAEYRLPILPAYAIEYAELRVDADFSGIEQAVLLEGRGLVIDGEKVIWTSYRHGILGEPRPVTLIVNYHGIRSYDRLFPAVQQPERVERLARFYEEADKGFEEGAWLSFLVMSGAVFEGLLYDRLNAKLTYDELAKKALQENLVTQNEYRAIDQVRIYRNSIHLSREGEKYPTRADAMDVRKVLDDMIVRFSYGHS